MKSTNALLFIAILFCGVEGYFSYKTSEDVQALKEQVQITEQKVDSLMLAMEKIATTSTKATTSSKTASSSNKQPKSFWEALFSELEAEEKAAAAQKRAEAAKAKVTVSTSYRLEDRYVVGKVELPEYLGTQGGQVTVNITVDRFGTVNKTSIADGATITDPEVLESVRRAALKTDFNTKYDDSESAEGTITYTFKKK